MNEVDVKLTEKGYYPAPETILIVHCEWKDHRFEVLGSTEYKKVK